MSSLAKLGVASWFVEGSSQAALPISATPGITRECCKITLIIEYGPKSKQPNKNSNGYQGNTHVTGRERDAQEVEFRWRLCCVDDCHDTSDDAAQCHEAHDNDDQLMKWQCCLLVFHDCSPGSGLNPVWLALV